MSANPRRAWARWLGYASIAVVFVIACALLSAWQFARRDEAVQQVDLLAANYDAAAQPLANVLPSTDSYTPNQEWLPVTASGTYLAGDQLLVRNRPHEGQPGFEILTPLQLASGDVFIVDRGWVPTGSKQDYPDHVPQPPTGKVTVTARLHASEPTIAGQSATTGQIGTVHLPSLDALFDGALYAGAYGLLAEPETPSSETGILSEKPTLTEGNHLSYAFQWIAFAVMAVIALIWGVRTERKARRRDAATAISASSPQRASRRRRDADSEIEDAADEANRRISPLG